jgi:hypothetical protein
VFDDYAAEKIISQEREEEENNHKKKQNGWERKKESVHVDIYIYGEMKIKP